MPARGERSRRGRPSTSTVPSVNGSAPNRARASSVRPAPCSPAMPTISPARTSRSMPASTALPPPRTASRTSPMSSGAGALGEVGVELAADHHRDEATGGRVGGGHRVDPAPVLEDGDAVGDGEDLAQPVRDVEDGDALLAQPAHQRQQRLGLVVGQRGGGLVHHDDAGVERAGLDDLDHLLLRHRERAHQRAGPERPLPQLVEQPLRVGVHAAAVDDAEPAGLAADPHVLGHRALGQEVELLVDDRHARRPGPGPGGGTCGARRR